MKELMNNEVTMTLKEITDLLNVRHNDAMRIVEKMAEVTDFGALRILRTSYLNNFGGEIALKTYALTQRQSIAVGARLNTDMLMKLIDRWQELESKQNQVQELDYLTSKVFEYQNRIKAIEQQLYIDREATQNYLNYVKARYDFHRANKYMEIHAINEEMRKFIKKESFNKGMPKKVLMQTKEYTDALTLLEQTSGFVQPPQLLLTKH